MFIYKHVHYVNLVNIIVLVGMSYWQIDDNNKYPALIFPLLFGVMMLPMNNSLRDKNKQIIKVATVLTVLTFCALIYASIKVFELNIAMDMMRISVMLLTTLMSLIGLVICIKRTRHSLI